MKILLDTDIGSDIDDAVCLAYLLSHPECELLGITTVTGEAVKRAQLASALCQAAGKDIPIFPGSEKPLLVAQQQPHAPQAEALARWPHMADFPKDEAISFLNRAIRANPGEVTLLGIGPLTNLGLLFATYPDLPPLLKSLVLMCGTFFGRSGRILEWNASCDPHATAIVYAAEVAQHRSLGLDVTTQVVMSRDDVQARFQSPLLRVVADFAGEWFARKPHIVFHDPLAAVSIFEPNVCLYGQGTVSVELASAALQGATVWHPGSESPRHEVAVGVDAGRFFDRYFATVV
jgi:inosine-uridine nucleoside N-ribohydrolase